MNILNLTNFNDHPTDPTWMVFRFSDRGMANEFLEGMDQAGIPYEADDGQYPVRLIGVKQRYRDAAIRVNYQVLGRHRRPFIGSAPLRWGLMIIMALSILLAIVGAIRH